MNSPAPSLHEIPHGVEADDWRQWVSDGAAIVRQQSAASWWLTDWIADGVARLGPAAAGAAAAVSGKSMRYIYVCLAVASTFPPDSRRDGLTFTHHRTVVSLPEAERSQLLDAAEFGSWTVAQLRTETSEARGCIERQRLLDRIRELEDGPADVPRNVAEAHAKRTEMHVRDACRRIVCDYAEITSSINSWQQTPEWRSLHGNTRKAALRRISKMLADAQDRIAAMADETLTPLLQEDGE